MAIRRISPPTASTPGFVPDIEIDYNAQNDMLQALTLNTTPQIPISLSGVLPRGTILNAGGVLYRADADNAITPGVTPGKFVELVPSTDGSELVPYWVGSLGDWNTEYQGFYSPDGNLMLAYSYEQSVDINTDVGSAVNHADTSATIGQFCADPDNLDFYIRKYDDSTVIHRFANRSPSVSNSLTGYPQYDNPWAFYNGDLYSLLYGGTNTIVRKNGFSNTVLESVNFPDSFLLITFVEGDICYITSAGAPAGSAIVKRFNGFSNTLKSTVTLNGAVPSGRLVAGFSSNGSSWFTTSAVILSPYSVTMYLFPLAGGDALQTRTPTTGSGLQVLGTTFSKGEYYYQKANSAGQYSQTYQILSNKSIKFYNSLKKEFTVYP